MIGDVVQVMLHASPKTVELVAESLDDMMQLTFCASPAKVKAVAETAYMPLGFLVVSRQVCAEIGPLEKIGSVEQEQHQHAGAVCASTKTLKHAI